MARLARAVFPGLPHHVTQRGNGRQQTFFRDAIRGLKKSLSYNVPNRLDAFARSAKESRIARIKPTSEPSASVRVQRPHQAAEANRSNVRIDVRRAARLAGKDRRRPHRRPLTPIVTVKIVKIGPPAGRGTAEDQSGAKVDDPRSTINFITFRSQEHPGTLRRRRPPKKVVTDSMTFVNIRAQCPRVGTQPALGFRRCH